MRTADPRRLRVLIVDDSDTDAALLVRHLEQGGFLPEWDRVRTEAEFMSALDPALDVILADFHLPAFGARRALDLIRARNMRVPLILVSDSIDEAAAIQALRDGAADYLHKDRLGRLGHALTRAIAERRQQWEKQLAQEALENAEDLTRFALNAARVGVWESDLTTGAVRWSQMLEVLHGVAPGTFGGTFEAFLDTIHPDDRDDVAKAILESTRLHTDSNLLYRTRWLDGTVHWISGTGKILYDALDVPVRAAGVAQDVTERHVFEEHYRQVQKVESIGQLAGGIAHDFNNLLTSIQGYCECLSTEIGVASPHQGDIGEIRAAADRAAALTRQLLAFSRKQILEPKVFDLRDSLRGMEAMLKRLIGENLSVTVRVTDEAARVKADPGQIEQVILNLALNARDAMPDGGSLLLEVTTVALDESYAWRHVGVKAGRYVMLGVSDTGIGMDAATQARIFEPFFTTKPRDRGTGLGLSTVYGIVKQSGGNIWAYSELGRGSTFKVYIPRVEDALDQSTSPVEPDILGGTETILVVEDEPGVRQLVRRVLQRYGYRVLVAATPHEAIALARSHPAAIHLLISDVVLPEMSGRSLAEQVTASRPEMRVMYMSGYTDEAIVHHGVLDADAPFLQKPFTPAGLARKVRIVLG